MQRPSNTRQEPGSAVASSAVVFVVEDDPRTANLIRLYLEEAGYAAHLASDGSEALRRIREVGPDLVILDLMLPGMDGWDVCRTLRGESEVPILILSARHEEEDRLLGLGLGADDYVIKPFSPREVVARVRAILRRAQQSGQSTSPPPQRLGCDALQLYPTDRRVVAHGRDVDLTPSEFRILSALMGCPGRTFERSELLDHLYPGGGQVVPKVVDVHIGKLRQKIERDPSLPAFVVTVRGFGYRYARGRESAAAGGGTA